MRSSAHAAVVLIAACSVDNDIVGGDCAVGYERCGSRCCVAGTDAAGTSGDGGGNGGETGTGGPDGGGNGDGGGGDLDSSSGSEGGSCTPPEILCGNHCIDPTSDPLNCGACGKVCPSNSCVNGKCQGSAPGHLVTIGHDYETPPQQSSSQSRVVVNAMLLPLSNPVRVLSYERYSNAIAVSNVKTVVTAVAKLLGRSITFTAVVQDNQVPTLLDITTYDVLFVPDQTGAPKNALASLASGWKQTMKLDDFEQAGGVMVVLDGASGVGEMPDFLTATGLLAVSAHQQLTAPSLAVVAPNDAVGAGVVSPYVPTNHTAVLSTEANGGNVTYVVTKQPKPAVVHKVFP